MPRPRRVALVLSDVDGTLLSSDKVLTARTLAAVRALREAGIHFAITSSRPPRGMQMLIEPLGLVTPLGGFNGGLIVDPSMAVLQHRTVPRTDAETAHGLILAHGLDAWVYDDRDWLVPDLDGPSVQREVRSVQFQPRASADVGAALDRAIKLVGVSDDHDAVVRCEAAVRAACGHHLSATRSQPRYLDITHADANKGAFVAWLSRKLQVPASEIVAIGDGLNDIPMLERCGLGIAMGNAGDEVKAAAGAVTVGNDEDGFAEAIECFVLGAGA